MVVKIKDSIELFDGYVGKTDWRTKENTNQSFSYPGFLGYAVGHTTADIALRKIFPAEVSQAHNDCFIHLHDLNGLCPYCLGLDLEMMLYKGIDDYDGPPKHFDTALGQMDSLIFLVSQQIAGAVAFNSVDILLSAYIMKDHLSYKQVLHEIQQFVHRVNVKGRIGYQSPFLNFQLDCTVPKRLREEIRLLPVR